MGIRINTSVDPMSARALGHYPPGQSTVICAESDAARLLRTELSRYCNGQTMGRSFLIAGHRGAGKTTMVWQVLTEAIHQARAGQLELRPLPVMLHGPSLFQTAPDAGMAPTAETALERSVRRTALPLAPPTIEDCASAAITQIILSLHRAVVRDFSDEYRRTLLRRAPGGVADAAELAAQFEIELTEDPAPMRLREFWSHAGALDSGVLFDRSRPPGQGGRELVALNGMCHAHQRLSGELKTTDTTNQKYDRHQTLSTGFDLKAADALKPIAAVISGALVGGGVAAGSGETAQPLIVGLLTAVLASLVLKRSSTSETKRVRTLDMSFMPDLSASTLDRVLPALLERLRAAGLAPIIVIDELDKVDKLVERFDGLVGYLKKLVAETVFTCFLTDRAYHERLRLDLRNSAYSKAYSYFSHRALVAFEPIDFANYLDRLLIVDASASVAQPTSGAAATPGSDARDLEILKWFLRHRSQMHALNLSRELMQLRGDGDILRIAPGQVRSRAYLIEVTLQVAIEFQLTTEHVTGWAARQGEMRQTLFDALYYLSRQWLRGEERIDLTASPNGSKGGFAQFKKSLEDRMNLDGAAVAPWGADDLRLLEDVLEGVVRFLGQQNDHSTVRRWWTDNLQKRVDVRGASMPHDDVFASLLLGSDSLIVGDTSSPRGKIHQWRYSRSDVRRLGSQQAPNAAGLPNAQTMQAVASIRKYEQAIWSALRRSTDAPRPHSQALSLLGDEMRVLPPVPPVSRLLSSIATVESGASGSASSAELEDACRDVTEFRRMLMKQARQTRDALVAAGFIGGVWNGDADRAVAVRRGLELLSHGLRFARDGLHAAERTTDFTRTLAEQFGQRLPTAQQNGQEFGRAAQADTDVSTAYRLGIAYAKSLGAPGPATTKLVDAAWQDFHARALTFIPSGTDGPLTCSELLCAARRIGPSALLGMDLAEVTLQTWSTLLLKSLDEQAIGAKTGTTEHAPRWLSALALRRLGLDSLSDRTRQRVFDELNKLAPVVPDDKARLAAIRDRPMMSPAPRPEVEQMALFYTAANDSLAVGWKVVPGAGLLLLIQQSPDPGKATSQPSKLAGLISTLTSSASEVVPPLQSEPRGPQTISVPLWSVPNRHFFVYRLDMPGMRQPFIVAPTGPDELLSRMSVPS